ncbi:capZ-interacting protein isoform X2 [Amia ocellicauda]|uniref:capZ-interacting protein isoform X2 n=1 Tax=Amia ocellicauda TaxID=2972642 RepID=UPI003464E403
MEDRSAKGMEATEDKPVKPSVAELAGKFKGQPLSCPAGTEGNRPIRRRPPNSLKLKDPGHEEKTATTSSHPPKVKPKNSPLIEKLQANLALSPTALLHSPKSPGIKLQPSPFVSPATTPSSPSVRLHSSEDETPASFEKPAEGVILPSIQKGRARVSIKRRPPTRQHRKSASEEPTGQSSTPAKEHPQQNEEDDVFEMPKEPEELLREAQSIDVEKTQDEPGPKDLQEKEELKSEEGAQDKTQEAPAKEMKSEAVKEPSQYSPLEPQASDSVPQGPIETDPEQACPDRDDSNVKPEEETSPPAEEEKAQKSSGDEKEQPKATGE